MEQFWIKIENWLRKNNSKLIKTLQNGVIDAEINILESNIGVKLPEDFIQFYKIHNGQNPYSEGLIDGEELLCTIRILEEWNIWKKLVDSGSFTNVVSSSDKEIKSDWYNKQWIPITYDGAGNHYCLDLNPTDEGNYGQVIRVWHDNSPRSLEAPSFKTWICYFVEDLEAKKYKFGNVSN